MIRKHIARFGKVWKEKSTGKIHGRELVLPYGASISEYTMVPEPVNVTPFAATRKGKYNNEQNQRGNTENI